MNPALMTAAHRTLPFGTTLKIVNQQNGKSVVIRINDRGPFARGRVIDLSKAAADELDFISSGLTSVCLVPTPSSARLARI
jgi:rare lipoprotein A